MTTKIIADYKPRLETLACWRTQEEKQKYKSKILNKIFVFTRHKVVEYVDYRTGEIVSAEQAKHLGVTEYNYEPMTLERTTILDSFRKEVKEFALFVLIFRNKRRGVSPNIHQVVDYYSRYTGKRLNNIKSRLLPELYGRIISSDTLMMPPFQINDKRATAAEHLQEDFIAENKFFTLMKRKGCRLEEAA